MKEMQVTAKPKFFATALIACAVIISTVTATTAQNWPSKLINLIVPFPPGGTSDVAARLISDKLSTALGQPVVIDNRAGVSGVLGTQFAAKASGDGYTLLLSSIGPFAFAPSTPNMTAYDPLGDFAQVAMLGSIPLVLYVNNDFPARSVADLVSFSKSKPGGLNFGTSGTASPSHLFLERFKMSLNLDIVNVPFRGTAASVVEIMAGRVHGSFDTMPPVLSTIQSEKVRALAVTGAQRNPLLPDVPTMAEAGYPDLEATSWFGIAVPASTPREIVVRLNREINVQIQSSQLKARFNDLGFMTRSMTPDEVTRFIEDEITKWKPIVVATKVSFQ
jgi:tripartite-type tricarboxylate transporter receptor subunit TctC